MAFLSNIGNILRQNVAKHSGSDLQSSRLSIFHAIRFMSSMSSSKLFVGGLSYSTDGQSLKEAFTKYGELILWRTSTSLRKLRMALRRLLGFSDSELMRSDSKPCSRLVRQTASTFTVGGGLAFWVLCTLHYGPRITVPRSLRWAACGAVSVSTTSALMVRLLSPECEPQNIAAYKKAKGK